MNRQSLTLSRVFFLGFILELKSTCKENYYCPTCTWILKYILNDVYSKKNVYIRDKHVPQHQQQESCLLPPEELGT